MSHIVAGRFERSIDADAALAELPRAGFRSGEYESFYVPPPGQRDIHPLGGDVHSDAGARKAGWGAVVGAAVGAVLGLLLGAFVAGRYGFVVVLLGAGLGAYVGSFAGGMVRSRAATPGEASPEHPLDDAPAGQVVAINVDRLEMQSRAVELLRRHGARDVGRAEGDWRNGTWRDFDPRSPLAAI